MGEWAEDRGDDEEDEDNDGYEVGENDDWPAAASEGAVGDPDSDEGVRGCEGVSDGRVFVDLCDGVDRRVALFVVCFEPEDERGEWLEAKRLHCCVG